MYVSINQHKGRCLERIVFFCVGAAVTMTLNTLKSIGISLQTPLSNHVVNCTSSRHGGTADAANSTIESDIMKRANSPPSTIHNAINPKYLHMLQEAKRRTAMDLESIRPPPGSRGIVVGFTGGKKFQYTINAMKNAYRIRHIIQAANNKASEAEGNDSYNFDSNLKIALATDQRHADLLHSCDGPQHERPREVTDVACRLWTNGTLFDDIVTLDGQSFIEMTTHGHYPFYMLALQAYLLMPYELSLYVDSDAYSCPGVGKIFYMIKPFSKKLWAFMSTKEADIVTAHEQFPFAGYPQGKKNIGNMSVLTDWEHFAERNTGAILLRATAQTRTFLHFLALVGQDYFKDDNGDHDQPTVRIALYLFKKLQPDFIELTMPMHTACRSYPGWEHAGIDGTLNGMLPLTANGKRCRECSCSPCLISHFRSNVKYELRINGKMGWEDAVDELFR